ncbi:hypothetical protein GIB67_017735 [Kingdonia uniflora]|uniref:Uncharacterized protein n=1 Tax=Kingdonia uniflora TaxID=39325 RepID=A0A7J7LPX2_9MAGN|nr:hypothetical protein GIB67_017735 [Kingdonia uniflora]
MGLLKGILEKEALVVIIGIVMVVCWVPSLKALGWLQTSWLNARQSFMGWNMQLPLVGLLLGLNRTPRRRWKPSKQTTFLKS